MKDHISFGVLAKHCYCKSLEQERIHGADLFRPGVQTWNKSLLGIQNFQSLNCLLLAQRLSLIRDDKTFTVWIPYNSLLLTPMLYIFFPPSLSRVKSQLSCTMVTTERGYQRRVFIPITQSPLIKKIYWRCWHGSEWCERARQGCGASRCALPTRLRKRFKAFLLRQN